MSQNSLSECRSNWKFDKCTSFYHRSILKRIAGGHWSDIYKRMKQRWRRWDEYSSSMTSHNRYWAAHTLHFTGTHFGHSQGRRKTLHVNVTFKSNLYTFHESQAITFRTTAVQTKTNYLKVVSYIPKGMLWMRVNQQSHRDLSFDHNYWPDDDYPMISTLPWHWQSPPISCNYLKMVVKTSKCNSKRFK